MGRLIAVFFLVFSVTHSFCAESSHYSYQKKQTTKYRIYDEPVTKEEKKDISFIITYLADKSLISLLRHKSSLEDAGSRIDHVHPLRFLMCVFTDEELKDGIKSIYKRGGWVWSDFIGGLKNSLKDEFQRNNLRDDQISHFAATISMDNKEMVNLAHKNKWTDFVIHLIKNG